MKNNYEGGFWYSPSDLTSFVGCTHSTWMDYQTLSNAASIPATEEKSFADLIVQKGLEHEASYLDKLTSTFENTVRISRDTSFEKQLEATVGAMKSGVDVIYQGALSRSPWRGYPDFLIKSSDPSGFGTYSYQVFDTKLAKEPRPDHIIQICMYSDMLADIQGPLPRTMHLVTGDDIQHDFKVSDFYFYYLRSKQRFESFVAARPSDSYPEPCQHCDVCHWLEACKLRWQEDDHLSLVANIRRSQREKLEKSGIGTTKQLALMNPDFHVSGLDPDVKFRLRSQAALQLHRSETATDTYELIEASPGRGFERLPKPARGDLFFDIEGDPLTSGGLEYLFGVITYGDQGEIFKSWWAHDHAQEKQTFRDFMDPNPTFSVRGDPKIWIW